MSSITPDIVELILSLTAIEKQHFKRQHTGSKDYILLFDYVNQEKRFSTKGAIQFLTKYRQGAKTYSSGHISVLKQYLNDRILDSLRSFYSSKRTNYALLMGYINTDILMERGLNNLAKRELQKTTDKYFQSNFPLEKLLILRSKSILNFYESYEFTDEKHIHSLKTDRVLLAEQALLEIKYAHILSLLSLKGFREKKGLDFSKQILLMDFMQDESMSKDFSTKYLFHWVHAQIAELQGFYEDAVLHFEKTIKIWSNQPSYIESHPKMYLGTCFAFLQFVFQQKSINLNLLNEFDYDDLFARLDKIQLTKDAYLQYEQIFLIGKILSFKVSDHSSEIVKLAPKILHSLNLTITTPSFIKSLTYYIVSVAFVEQKEYKNAETLLNQLILNNQFKLNQHSELYPVIMMLLVFLQFELGNHKFLKSLLGDFKKRLTKFHLFNEFEKAYFGMFNQLISDRFKDHKQNVIARHKKILLEIINNDDRYKQMEYSLLFELTKANFLDSKEKDPVKN
jgi:hypothetical protein